MTFSQLCSPAIIYLLFSIAQIIIDTLKGNYNTAFMKLLVSIIFTILLNNLCSRGLNIISWFIVFIPFIMMTVVISILLFVFGLNPSTGKSIIHTQPTPSKLYVDARVESAKQNNLVTKTTHTPLNTTSSQYNQVKQTPEIHIRKTEKITIQDT